MWAAIQWLVVRISMIRWILKLGWLGALIPIAMLLKAIGWPLLLVLGVIALPVIALLFLFGLPIILVLIFGGLLIGLIGMVLAIGVVALKIGLFIVLPIWLTWKLVCWIRGKRGGDDGGTSATDSSANSTTSTTSDFTSSSDTTSGPTGDPLGGTNPA